MKFLREIKYQFRKVHFAIKGICSGRMRRCVLCKEIFILSETCSLEEKASELCFCCFVKPFDIISVTREGLTHIYSGAEVARLDDEDMLDISFEVGEMYRDDSSLNKGLWHKLKSVIDLVLEKKKSAKKG